MKKTARITHLLTGLQFIVYAVASIYWASSIGWWAIALAVVFALWLVSAGLMAVGYSMWPERFPQLSLLKGPGWKLRMRHVESIAGQLRDLGFEEIGVKAERTLAISVPSREFWHPQHRTFASLTGQMFSPAVSFMSVGECGTILYSGRAVQSRRRTVVSRLLVGSSVQEKLEDHLRGMRGEDIAPTQPHSERSDYREDTAPTAKQLLEWRLKLTREWYVASFAADEKWDAWRAEHAPTSVRVEELEAAESQVDEHDDEAVTTNVNEL